MADEVLKNNPFKGLKNKKVDLDLKLGDETISIIPEVEDAELFMSVSPTGDLNEIKKVTSIMIGMIIRSYPGVDLEDVKAYVAMNYADLFQSIAVLYGFVTKEKVEANKKKM